MKTTEDENNGYHGLFESHPETPRAPLSAEEARSLIYRLLKALQALDSDANKNLRTHGLSISTLTTATMGGPVPQEFLDTKHQAKQRSENVYQKQVNNRSNPLAAEVEELQALLDITFLLRNLLQALISAPSIQVSHAVPLADMVNSGTPSAAHRSNQ